MGQFENMTAFVRIVEAGSISRASEQLGTVKSAVSRRLAELEQDLGVQLLQRTTRTSSLTEAGRHYYQRAVQILADVNELNNSSSNKTTELVGQLRIAVPTSFGLLHLAPAINEFAELHPKLIIHLDFSDRQVDLVEEGFDLAIRIAALKDSTLIARRLAPINIRLCASPDYLKRHGAPKSPSDLKRHHALHFTHLTDSKWKFVSPQGKPVSTAINIKMSASNGDFLRSAAIAGHGIIRSPTFIIWRNLQNGSLVPVMTDYKIDPLNAYAIYPSTRYLSQRLRVLIDFLVKKFEGQPYWDRSGTRAARVVRDCKDTPNGHQETKDSDQNQ